MTQPLLPRFDLDTTIDRRRALLPSVVRDRWVEHADAVREVRFWQAVAFSAAAPGLYLPCIAATDPATNSALFAEGDRLRAAAGET